MSRIRVTIHHLVLKGFEPTDRKPLVDGLEAELSRFLANPENRAEWARPHRTPVLRLGRMSLESGPGSARKFGGGLALAIGKELKP
jgi:hypothetical protein